MPSSVLFKVPIESSFKRKSVLLKVTNMFKLELKGAIFTLDLIYRQPLIHWLMIYFNLFLVLTLASEVLTSVSLKGI